MNMPGKDEIIHEVRKRLDDLLKQQKLMKASKDRFWTSPVKTALCEACAAVFPGPLHFCAEDVDLPGQQWGRGQRPQWLPLGEWRLYDVTCLKCNGDFLKKVLLVAEVEWSNKKKILEDFRKLLMERAQLRVMVFNWKRNMSFKDLEEYVRQYDDNQAGDTYLLAAFRGKKIQYYQIDVDPTTLQVRGTCL